MGVAKIARRTFLVAAAAIAGGAAFGYYHVKKAIPNPLEDGLGEGESTFNPFIKITKDNTITIIAPRAEMGQGVSTTLAALAAEELDVSLDEVVVEHGPAAGAYYNEAALVDGGPFAFFDEGFLARTTGSAMKPLAKVLGLQVTGGSTSIRDYYKKMRFAGAGARMMLLEAAAQLWSVDVATLETADRHVVDPATGKKISYGELASLSPDMKVPEDIVLKDKKHWKLLGNSPARVDIPAKVTGEAVFGIDVELPDMVHGTVKLSPFFGSKARSHNPAAALKIPGVTKVIPLDTSTGSGFGIIATNTWAAFKGAQALEVEWEEASYPKTAPVLHDAILEGMKGQAGTSLRNDGDADLTFADAPRDEMLEAEYSAPYLAHATMEPMNATAQFIDGKLEIWSPNQAPTIIQSKCADLVGIESEDVIVNTTYLGGGFGRRAEIDFSLYAVEMAKHTDGKPIKVTWTREEDMTHDAYRPPAIGKMRARVKKGELPQSLDVHIGTPSIVASFLGRTFPSISPMGPDRTMIEGCFDQPYKIANYNVRGTAVNFPIPVGFWRSVGNSFNGFFHESFIDEIAHAAGKNPYLMRLELMADYPAAIGALQKVASMSRWGLNDTPRTGFGIAHTLSFGAWVAMVVQVSMKDDAIKIDKVWAAVELGTAFDPQIIKAQVMSGIVFGLSSAMGQEITFEDGAVVEQNFDSFDAMRINQCPEIEVEILETYHRVGGVGEVGTPPSIPALANAIFDLTGKRIRKLPLSSGVDFV